MNVSDRLLKQRLRNRQIEAMENLESALAVSKMGIFETLNIWDDFYRPDQAEWYDPPVYTQAEREALARVGSAVDAVSGSAAGDSWDADEIRARNGFSDLFEAASDGRRIFEMRGRFDEEAELTDEVLAR